MTQLESLTPNEPQDWLKYATPSEIEQIDRLLRAIPRPLWTPLAAQKKAADSQADEVFFGGSAGGGKSSALLGIALTQQHHAVIFRREYSQLRGLVLMSKDILGERGRFNANENLWTLGDNRFLEFGAVQHDEDKEKWQGRAHDFIGFDELAHFTRSQYRFLIGWNRSSRPGQRCRVVAAGNPPTSPEGRWVVEEWAPWLDETHHDPAEPGELRWYATIDGELVWRKSGEPFAHKGEVIYPRSRTFIPARVDDNPYLARSGYKSVLQSLPEPLRSQMLYGDFKVGLNDDPWQVCPTEWIRAAQARWTPDGGDKEQLSAVAADIARGGADKTVLAKRHGKWFARLERYPGKTTPDGQSVVKLLQRAVLTRPRTPVLIDVIGVGAAVVDLARQAKMAVKAIHFAERAPRRDRTNLLDHINYRSWCYWAFREALDPANGDNIALPPDPELLADLSAPRWSMTPSGIKIEAKEEIKRRIGRSPDCADAVVMAAIPTVPFTIGLASSYSGAAGDGIGLGGGLGAHWRGVEREAPAGVFGAGKVEERRDRDGNIVRNDGFPSW